VYRSDPDGGPDARRRCRQNGRFPNRQSHTFDTAAPARGESQASSTACVPAREARVLHSSKPECKVILKT
jgi:hypothetical protein